MKSGTGKPFIKGRPRFHIMQIKKVEFCPYLNVLWFFLMNEKFLLAKKNNNNIRHNLKKDWDRLYESMFPF